MQTWLDMLHAQSPPFSPLVVCAKLGVAIAIGLLIGFERQWAHKDFGVRTFSFVALLGGVTALMQGPLIIVAMCSVVLLAVLLNVRDILASRAVEGTTSAALILVFVLGALSGSGHIFTATACAIIMAWLLSLKPQFRAFAGGVSNTEIRSALLLGLFGFVIWPLLPNRFVDPWGLLNPREAWVTILVVASLGFVNYVLLRVYGTRGVGLTAILGGLVNSTAAAAELASTLPAAGLAAQTPMAVLLTSCSMFARNLLLLAIFARGAVRYAVAPLLAMTSVAALFVWRARRAADDEQPMKMELSSPVSVSKVARFGGLFLLIQIFGDFGARWLGASGLVLVSLVGGLVSSASSTAAAANLAAHGRATSAQAGMATVATSIVSTLMNAVIIRRNTKDRAIIWQVSIATLLQMLVGAGAVALQAYLPSRL